jgi:hypothetical protein
LQEAVFKLDRITEEFNIRILAKEGQDNDICRKNAMITNIMIGRQVLNEVIIFIIWVGQSLVWKIMT